MTQITSLRALVHYCPAGTNVSVVIVIMLKSGMLQNSISFSAKCHYFIILSFSVITNHALEFKYPPWKDRGFNVVFSVLTNHALEFKYPPWKDRGFNVVFKLTPPWSPQAEDTRAPVCTVCAA
jgi:hypothetical protein